MRRVLLVEGSGRGFLCHYVHALAAGLAGAGAEVRLVTGRRDELSGWPVPMAKAACLSGGLGGWACLAREVRRFRPDVVHFQWVDRPLLAAAFAAWLRRRGIASVYTPHNLFPHRRRWLSVPGFRRLYAILDAVVARDAHIAWGLQEMGGVNEERVAHLPGSPNLLAHPGMPRQAAPDIPPRGPEETRLLFFGHGSRRKGLADLLAALEGRDWPATLHLVVAGEGVAAGVDVARLRALGQRMAVTVADRYLAPAEVAHLFAESDLLLLPYAKQCKSPLPDLAAAFRLPVLRTERVAAARFVEGVHGLTVPPGDAAALGGVLQACLAGGRLAGFRHALAREEDVLAAARRLAESHLRLYEHLPRRSMARAPAAAPEGRHA